MLGVVGLGEDIVSAVLNASRGIIPVRSFVSRLIVDMHPDIGMRRDQHSRRDTRDGAYFILRMLIMIPKSKKKPSGKRDRTVCIISLCIPLVAIMAKQRQTMRPIRDTSQERTLELAQFEVVRDGLAYPENHNTSNQCDSRAGQGE